MTMPKTKYSFRIDDDLIKELDMMAVKNRTTRAEILRQALLRFLRAHDRPVDGQPTEEYIEGGSTAVSV